MPCSGVCWCSRLGCGVGCCRHPPGAAGGARSTLFSARPWKQGGKSREAGASSPSCIPAGFPAGGFTVGFPECPSEHGGALLRVLGPLERMLHAVQRLLHQGKAVSPPCLPASTSSPCLGGPWSQRGDRSVAGGEVLDGVLGRGFMASAGEDGVGAETWACSGQRARGEHQMDLQLSWARAAEEEWHTVELWDGSRCLGADCPGTDGCGRSRLSQLLRWVPWAGVSRCGKVQSWPLSTQSTIHLMAKSWHFCPEEHLGMPVSLPAVQAVCQECAFTAHGSCLPPMWNIILKGQGRPSHGASVTQNWI